MAAALTKPIIVPQYGNGVIDLYTPDPGTGAPTVAANFTVNVGAILDALFPAQGRSPAPNAVAVHGNDLFFTNSSSNSQAVFELPDYLQSPAAAISHAFVITLDGNDYTGLAFDAAGHLFTAEGDFGDNQIVEYTLPTSVPTAAAAAADSYTARTVIGDAGATSYFGDLTFDSGGNLWVADYANSRVVAFDAANLGGTDTWHSITNVAGALAVANTTTGLTGATANLFAEPEGVAFDGNGASANLWVGNNNDDGAGVLNTLTSLVKITPTLQSAILATTADTAIGAAGIQANSNVFVYNLPDNLDDSRPQIGGVAIDTTAGVLYANEEIGGNARAYPLATIADTPADPSSTLLAVTTTNPGNGGLAVVDSAIACFAEGTRILAAGGEVAVEALRVGDRVQLARGGSAPVRWAGHRRVVSQAVRVRAGAFGADMPLRDLVLSPDHAVFFDGGLVPIRYLLNGATVTRDAVGAVTYWHVELPGHDVILAEGLPAESYLDTGNRAVFVGGGNLDSADRRAGTVF